MSELYRSDDHPQKDLAPPMHRARRVWHGDGTVELVVEFAPQRPAKYSDGGSMMIAVFVALGVWAFVALGLIYFG